MSEQDVTVELFYSSTWNDHTAAVDMDRGDIRITQGATDAYSHAQPASCQLVFDNRDGTFNPKNPTSSLYGLIGRNTPIRVSVGSDVRFSGEVAAWTPRRGVKKDAWVNVVANGLTRRVGQGSAPVRSSMSSTIEATPDFYGYWPCEDGGSASQFAAGLPGLGAATVSGDVDPAQSAPVPGSAALPDLGDGAVSGSVPDYGGGSVAVLFMLEVPSGGLTDEGLLLRATFGGGGGTAAYVELRYLSGGDLRVTVVDEDGNDFNGDSTSMPSWISVDGRVQMIVMRMRNLNGALAEVSRFRLDSDGRRSDPSWDLQSDFIQALAPDEDYDAMRSWQLGGSLGGGVAGHVLIRDTGGSTSDLLDNSFDEDALTGFLGEAAGDRVERLCDEEDVTVTVTGTAGDTQAMGPQRVDALLPLVRECATADGAILADAVTQLGLAYRTGRSLYSQDAALTLDWDAGEIAEPLEPVTDDRNVRNDVTVRRPGGSSARAVRESGPLSTQDPPDGVGRYDTSDEVNVVSDGVLENQAGWRLHLGTVDEIRFPRVSIDLDAGTTLSDDVASVGLGDRLDLVNLPPEHVAVDEASLVVLGWTEKIGIHKRKVTFNCTSEAPYRIAEVGGGATLGTVGSTSATLAEDLTDAETDVDINCGAGPDWDHEGTDYDVLIGGERVIVTAAGAVSGTFPNRTQTLTVTRSVNGVTKAHSSGDPVAMADPIYIGL